MGCGMMTHGKRDHVATTASRGAIEVVQKQEIVEGNRCMRIDGGRQKVKHVDNKREAGSSRRRTKRGTKSCGSG